MCDTVLSNSWYLTFFTPDKIQVKASVCPDTDRWFFRKPPMSHHCQTVTQPSPFHRSSLLPELCRCYCISYLEEEFGFHCNTRLVPNVQYSRLAYTLHVCADKPLMAPLCYRNVFCARTLTSKHLLFHTYNAPMLLECMNVYNVCHRLHRYIHFFAILGGVLKNSL